MRNAKTELIVGLFALLAIIALTLVTIKAGRYSLTKKRGYIVYAYFDNAAGLTKRSTIKIAGVDAGSIEKIELEGAKAKVTMRLYPAIQIYSDATIYINTTGMLGDKYLEISPGTKVPFLKDGDHITDVVETANIDELVRNVSDISNQIMELISAMELTDLKASISEPIENLKVITADIKDIVSGNKDKFSRIVIRIDSITANMDNLLKENKGTLTTSAKNIEELSENLKQAAEDLRDILEKAGPEFAAVTEKADSAMDSVNAIANKINQGEGTIGKLVQDEELYESLDRTVKGLEGTLSSIERFRTFVTFRGDYLTRPSKTKGAFYLTLQPRDDKYYTFGIIKDPVGLVETTETTTDGQTVIEEKVEDRFEVTAHFAKRFSNTVLRIGLTENTFGVGADQFLLDNKLKLSLDAWDLNENEVGSEEAHITFTTDYFLFKNLFITGGFDNALNTKRSGAFFGAGVRFEDEDLKYLLGASPNISVD
jgi:phospholipid/cholesterol/gamma-HCH transport system substrate-binding protein